MADTVFHLGRQFSERLLVPFRYKYRVITKPAFSVFLFRYPSPHDAFYLNYLLPILTISTILTIKRSVTISTIPTIKRSVTIKQY